MTYKSYVSRKQIGNVHVLHLPVLKIMFYTYIHIDGFMFPVNLVSYWRQKVSTITSENWKRFVKCHLSYFNISNFLPFLPALHFIFKQYFDWQSPVIVPGTCRCLYRRGWKAELYSPAIWSKQSRNLLFCSVRKCKFFLTSSPFFVCPACGF